MNDESDAACDKRVARLFLYISESIHPTIKRENKKRRKNNRKETRLLVLSFTYTDTRAPTTEFVASWISWHLYILPCNKDAQGKLTGPFFDDKQDQIFSRITRGSA